MKKQITYTIQQQLIVKDNNRLAIKQIIEYLKIKGFKINTKHKTFYYTKYGIKIDSRIDIYAEINNKTYAIEADRRSPRQRTLKKLGNVTADYKIVLLRGIGESYNIGSIRVIYLNYNVE